MEYRKLTHRSPGGWKLLGGCSFCSFICSLFGHYTSLEAALAGAEGVASKGTGKNAGGTGEPGGQALRNAVIMTGQEAGRESEKNRGKMFL